jgi:hypothetical protein
MSAEEIPDLCPQCGYDFTTHTLLRPQPRLAMNTKLFLFAAGLVSAVLLVSAAFLAAHLVNTFTEGTQLRPRERGVITFGVHLLMIPFTLVPAWFCIRLAGAWPRRLDLRCRKCNWSGSYTIQRRKRTPTP